MLFETFYASPFQTNIYIIGDEASKHGVIIDPAAKADSIIDKYKEMGIEIIDYIILTHGHGDHIGAVAELKRVTDAQILINIEDNYLIEGATRELIPILRNIELFSADAFIKDKDLIKLGALELEIIETPGHTKGSVSIKCDNILIAGDTLFNGSVGRSDLPGGSHEQLIKSVKEKLFILPDETIVYPGHGEATTIGEEKLYNPFFSV